MSSVPAFFTFDPSKEGEDVTFYDVYTKAESAEEAAAFFMGGSIWVRREILTQQEYNEKYGDK